MLFLDRSIFTMSEGRLDGTLFKATKRQEAQKTHWLVHCKDVKHEKKGSLAVLFATVEARNLSDALQDHRRGWKFNRSASVQVFKMLCGLFATLNLPKYDGMHDNISLLGKCFHSVQCLTRTFVELMEKAEIPTYSHVHNTSFSESLKVPHSSRLHRRRTISPKIARNLLLLKATF